MIHTVRRLAIGLAVLIVVTAISGADTVSEVRRPQPAGQVQVVALGDSVTSGSNCNCSAFPQL